MRVGTLLKIDEANTREYKSGIRFFDTPQTCKTLFTIKDNVNGMP